jgi:hypothetical protein
MICSAKPRLTQDFSTAHKEGFLITRYLCGIYASERPRLFIRDKPFPWLLPQGCRKDKRRSILSWASRGSTPRRDRHSWISRDSNSKNDWSMNGITSQKSRTFVNLPSPSLSLFWSGISVIIHYVPLLHWTRTWLESAAETSPPVLWRRSQIFGILQRPCWSNFPAECIIARIIITAFGGCLWWWWWWWWWWGVFWTE